MPHDPKFTQLMMRAHGQQVFPLNEGNNFSPEAIAARKKDEDEARKKFREMSREDEKAKRAKRFANKNKFKERVSENLSKMNKEDITLDDVIDTILEFQDENLEEMIGKKDNAGCPAGYTLQGGKCKANPGAVQRARQRFQKEGYDVSLEEVENIMNFMVEELE